MKSTLSKAIPVEACHPKRKRPIECLILREKTAMPSTCKHDNTDGLGSSWQPGNCNTSCTETTLPQPLTMKLCTVDYVSGTGTLATNSVSLHTARKIFIYLLTYLVHIRSLVLHACVTNTLLATFLPVFLPAFFLAHLHWPNADIFSHKKAQQTQFMRKKVHSNSTTWGHFARNPPRLRPQNEKSSRTKKSNNAYTVQD